MTDLYRRLGELLVQRCDVQPGDLSPETTFERLGLSSMDLVTLAMAFERELGVEVDEDDFPPDWTLVEAARHLEKRVAERPNPLERT
ncbi:acyl carrier protein [Glycomyces paridis]|uniref:Acyl carrier protein n=1 Tax=Glycomyces paridis TaxID=2126555 RepID=A0A4S8PGX6_9ACTN|nr:acyl carrier protein [Glycomyces paridis]THV29141.1 acyl carrier protein [Glycomyces paridis]